MIEQDALVVAVDGQNVWIETHRQSACGQCSAGKGCGTASMAAFFAKKSSRLHVINTVPIEVAVGDKVVIGISEHSLVRGSLTVYMVPLLAMIGFGLMGDYLGRQLATSAVNGSEFISILSVLTGLVCSFLWLKGFAKKKIDDDKYQSVLLRRLRDMNYV
jgi:sigma-E factor negative regulatory protein RseC